MKIELSNISSEMPLVIGLLICSSSFEDRWYKIAENIPKNKLKKIIIIQKEIEVASWDKGIKVIHGIHGDITETFDIDGNTPVELWENIAINLISKINHEPNITLIDITTFTHEVTLFFVALLKEKKLTEKVMFIYAGASEYCTSENVDEKWLSQGVKEIRSVLGYPGSIRPSKKSHLIILVGFETERAKELIVQYEPTSVSLGIGLEPYNDEFHQTNIWHKHELKNFIKSFESSRMEISEFNFSCSDPITAKDEILIEAKKYSDKNITIAPMNTKVSTVAAGMAAIDNQTLKICYVEPVEYNKKYYSLPGEAATIFKL